MRPVINYEFLLGPIFAPDIEVLERVAELRMLKDHVGSLSEPPILEENTLTYMIERNLFPSENLYKERFAKIVDFPFGARDVVRMVMSILEHAPDTSNAIEDRVVEWASKEFSPVDLDGIEADRSGQLYALFEKLSLASALGEAKYSVLHYSDRPLPDTILLNGCISYAYPEPSRDLPMNFSERLSLFPMHQSHVCACDPQNMFEGAITDADFKYAMYVGARNLHEKLGAGCKVDWDDFSLSERFVDSLRENECMPGARYCGAAFETIIRVLMRHPSCDVNEFTKSDDDSAPRVFGDYTAYRVHVTKGGRALRLMFWENDDGKIVLANIGNKGELHIEDPE
ncbi:hypothetical protein [Ectopseudomonas mendocina]|uniref:hypothetical protein n=1 Tax=Ectopseudomonas mendocina TaxID=300 RepID=UPI0011D21BF4|nr:hypothetical protein [Pseudomonas mendocina]